MRTRIEYDGRTVTLHRGDPDTGEHVTERYTAGLHGGYVWRVDRYGDRLGQACSRLARLGDTLLIASTESLVDVIRREHRARMRRERRTG